MKANLPRAVFAINSLMATNNERFSYYKEAASSCKDMELKLLFMKYAIQSQSFTTYLNSWLSAYGSVYTPLNNQNSTVKKWWSQIRHAITLDERILMLKECDELERNAIKRYRTAIMLSFFPSAVEVDIKKQAQELETSYQSLQEFRMAFGRGLQVA